MNLPKSPPSGIPLSEFAKARTTSQISAASSAKLSLERQFMRHKPSLQNVPEVSPRVKKTRRRGKRPKKSTVTPESTPSFPTVAKAPRTKPATPMSFRERRMLMLKKNGFKAGETFAERSKSTRVTPRSPQLLQRGARAYSTTILPDSSKGKAALLKELEVLKRMSANTRVMGNNETLRKSLRTKVSVLVAIQFPKMKELSDSLRELRSAKSRSSESKEELQSLLSKIALEMKASRPAVEKYRRELLE